MRAISQLAAIIAIAVGAGLFQYGRQLDSPASASTVQIAMRSTATHDHEVSAFASGWGVGFMTLGALILVVPWINAYVSKNTLSTGAGSM